MKKSVLGLIVGLVIVAVGLIYFIGQVASNMACVNQTSHVCVSPNPVIPLVIAVLGLIITVTSLQIMRFRKAIFENTTIEDGKGQPASQI